MARPTPAVAEQIPRAEHSPGAAELAQSYHELRYALLSFLHGRVSDAAVAEDLLHEVFLKALAAIDRGAAPANLPAWLHRIASNAVVDYYRTRREMAPVPDDLVACDAPYRPSPEQTLALCLEPFINQLPVIYRDAMLATAIEGRTLAALSKELGLSHSALKSRVSRARRMLRAKVLECCHVELSGSGEVTDYRRRDDRTLTSVGLVPHVGQGVSGI